MSDCRGLGSRIVESSKRESREQAGKTVSETLGRRGRSRQCVGNCVSQLLWSRNIIGPAFEHLARRIHISPELLTPSKGPQNRLYDVYWMIAV